MFCCCSCCCLLISLLLIYKLVDWLLRLPRISRYADRCIFITGCDSGFGHELAKRLDSLGCHVIAGCLTEAGKTSLQAVCSSRLFTLQVDVSSPDSVRKAFQTVDEQLRKIGKDLWAVVNNAGIGCPVGPPDWLSVDDYKRTAAVNLYGVIDVTTTFLPLIKRSRGRVVIMSSIAGRFSAYGVAPYAVAKYGLEAFGDGLRRTLRPFGCSLSLIEPCSHRTDLITDDQYRIHIQKAWDAAPEYIRQEYGDDYLKYMKTGLVAKANQVTCDGISDVIDAYEHAILGSYPRPRYLVGIYNFTVWMPVQLLPEWLGDWLLDKFEPERPLPAAVAKRR